MKSLASIVAAASIVLTVQAQTRGNFVGNDHLVGAARSQQLALDKQFCSNEGAIAGAQMQRQVAAEIALSQQRAQGQRFSHDSGSITRFDGRTSDGTTFSGTAHTTPNSVRPRSPYGEQSPYQAALEGELQGRLENAPREAAILTALRCMNAKGWLFQRH